MLSYEKFLQLSREEQNRRIYELSEHDRFRARMQDSETGAVVKETASAEELEKHRKFMEELKKAIEDGNVNLL